MASAAPDFGPGARNRSTTEARFAAKAAAAPGSPRSQLMMSQRPGLRSFSFQQPAGSQGSLNAPFAELTTPSKASPHLQSTASDALDASASGAWRIGTAYSGLPDQASAPPPGRGGLTRGSSSATSSPEALAPIGQRTAAQRSLSMAPSLSRSSSASPTRTLRAQTSAAALTPSALAGTGAFSQQPQLTRSSVSPATEPRASLQAPRDSALLDQTASELLRTCQRITELEGELATAAAARDRAQSEAARLQGQLQERAAECATLSRRAAEAEAARDAAKADARAARRQRATLSEAASAVAHERSAEALRRQIAALEGQLATAQDARCAHALSCMAAAALEQCWYNTKAHARPCRV